MVRTRVKICGITRSEDGKAAAEAGADAIGLVFHRASPRHVDTATAARIAAALPPFVAAVGLFLDPDADEVGRILHEVPLAALQFHGRESQGFCASFERPYLKGVGMAEGVDLDERAAAYRGAQGLLVDSHAPGGAGGTGQAFDWTRLPRERGYGLVLAGGLRPDNVAQAVATVGPDAVDVSSGVESERGIKDESLIYRFIEEVQRGDRDRSQ